MFHAWPRNVWHAHRLGCRWVLYVSLWCCSRAPCNTVGTRKNKLQLQVHLPQYHTQRQVDTQPAIELEVDQAFMISIAPVRNPAVLTVLVDSVLLLTCLSPPMIHFTRTLTFTSQILILMWQNIPQMFLKWRKRDPYQSPFPLLNCCFRSKWPC